MTRLAFFFDSSTCSGCKTCQMACKDKNNLPVGQVWRRVYEVTGGGWKKAGASWTQDVFAYNLSVSCNHCEDPICSRNCPTKAIRKREDGIVLIDQGACIGCKYCAWACPYGALQFNPEKGVMGKCDLCVDYIDQGKNPSCVDACPMRALDFGNYDELLQKYGEPSHIHPMPDPSITDPSIVIRPHRTAGGTDATVSNVEEVKSG
jgi:anaerobic dimethyl sulfoxide reductase subunit B (iron-sulfur subunit)